MKTTEKVGWVVVVLVSTIMFCAFISGSDDWKTNKLLVQEAVYEYVPASRAEITAFWVGSAALALLIGGLIGVIICSATGEA